MSGFRSIMRLLEELDFDGFGVWDVDEVVAE